MADQFTDAQDKSVKRADTIRWPATAETAGPRRRNPANKSELFPLRAVYPGLKSKTAMSFWHALSGRAAWCAIAVLAGLLLRSRRIEPGRHDPVLAGALALFAWCVVRTILGPIGSSWVLPTFCAITAFFHDFLRAGPPGACPLRPVAGLKAWPESRVRNAIIVAAPFGTAVTGLQAVIS